MKTQSSLRVRALKCLILALTIVLCAFSFTACNTNGTVTEIAIDDSSVQGYYVLGDFDIGTVKLIVTYDNGDTNVISVEKSMLTTEGKNSLATAGEKSITVYYKNKSAVLDIYLVADGSQMVCVTFNDSANNLIVKKYTLTDGAITAPEAPAVSGQTFAGWVTASGASVDLSKVSASVTVIASYTVNKSEYAVKFYDYKGKELSSDKISAGGKIASSDAPSVNLSSYPELSAFNWSVSFPCTVNADTVIYMVPVYKSFSVLYAYALETDSTSYTYISSAAGVVTYGTDVSAKLSDVKKTIAAIGYEIVTEPTAQTTITKDTTFVYIVRNASVGIKVYNDADAKTVKTSVSARIGSLFTFPSTAAAVTGKSLDGWQIKGGTEVFDIGETWTVTSEYGMNAEFIPVYAANTISVNFSFVFSDIKLKNDGSKNYSVSLNVSDAFAMYDAVTYAYIDDLLSDITEKSADYLKFLNGISVGTVNTSAKDNGSADERTAAFGEIGACGIASVSVTVGGAAYYVTPSAPKSLTSAELTFSVNLTGETKGLVFTKSTVQVEGEDVITYAVTGLGADYVSGTNIYIPDTHTASGETTAYGVTAVNTAALAGKTIVHLPAGLEKIADGAFAGSTIYGDAEAANLTEIGANAFANAVFSGDVTFSALASLGEKAFYKAEGTETTVNLGEKLTAVGTSAFEGVTGIKKIILPETVTGIGEKAFYNAETADISSVAKVVSVGAQAFAGTSLSALVLPSVVSVDSGAFADMKNLVSVSFGSDAVPETSLSLDITVFAGDSAITSFAFGACVSAVVGTSADFAEFPLLSDITVSSASTHFYADNNVLYYVDGTAYTLVYCANNKIGTYVSALPASATGVTVLASAFDNAEIAVLDFSGVTVSSFQGVTAGVIYAAVVDEAQIADAKTALGTEKVFASAADCTFGYDEATKLVYEKISETSGETTTVTATVTAGYKYDTEITVPGKFGDVAVTAIADGAFENYTKLEKLDVKATLSDWDSSILDGCGALTEFSVAGWTASDDFSVTIDDFAGNGWYASRNVIYIGGHLFGYNNTAKDAGGKAVTTVSAADSAVYFGSSVPDDFFFVDGGSGNNVCNVTEVAFADTVESIGRNAFKGCASLVSVNLNKVTKLGSNAFMNCTSLSEIVFNGTTLEDGVFEGCVSLSSATLDGAINQNKINGIYYYYLPIRTFYGCKKLETVSFDKINAFASDAGETSYAFGNCSSLASFDFSVIKTAKIPQAAFEGCSALNYVDFTSAPDITSIGIAAFRDSGLLYVKLSSYIASIGKSAFEGCSNLVVEMPYDQPGGLYAATDSVGADAFDSGVKFFISATVDASETFLYENGSPRWTSASTYPTVDFDFTDNMTDTSVSLGMLSVSNKILFEAEDVVAATIEGYTFVGWYREENAVNAVSFPIVITSSITLYAKYYSKKSGSLDATTDVKYVYYVAAAPEIDLLDTETSAWYIVKNNVEGAEITSFPYIVEASAGDEFVLRAKITSASEVVKTDYEDVGVKGYAIVKYTDSNANNVSIPDVYNDGENGEADIIAVYAGAFKNENLKMKEFTLPAGAKAIFTGDGDKNTDISAFNSGTTFNGSLETVTVPASVEYIADGVFEGLTNLTDIVFEENSGLLYATEDAFYGSGWWLDSLEKAASTNGFIVAGRLALQFVGTGSALTVPSSDSFETTVSGNYGFVESEDALEMLVTVYYGNGAANSYTLNLTAEQPNEGVYKYSFTAAGIDIMFALNSTDASNFTKTLGKNIFVVGDTANVIAITFKSVKDTEVSVPSDVIKLNAAIFAGNTEIETLIVNAALTEVGDSAFASSSLKTVRYGATNTEQYSSKMAKVGVDAFKNTTWYSNENVIFGTLYLKYNNRSGKTSITITDSITAIAKNAFLNATLLSSVDVSSLDTLKTIGAFAFKGSYLTSVKLPASVISIGRGAFMNCASLNSADLSDAKIAVLSEDAFRGDNKLQSLILGDTVVSLEKNSLEGCDILATLTAAGVTEIKTAEDSADNDVKFVCGLEGTAWYKTSAKTNDVFLSLGSVLVKYIMGTDTKADEKGVLTVEIPAGTVTVSQSAFYGVDYVTRVIIPESVTKIGDYAFENCGTLEEAQIGGNVKEIGAFAFMGCGSLKTAVLPDGLETIGDGAFKGTALTTEVLDGKGVRTGDEGYVIPDTVTEIGQSAFQNVATLTYVKLGSNIEKIGSYAFDTGATGRLYKISWDLDIDSSDGEAAAPIFTLAGNIVNGGVSGKTVFASSSGISIRIYVSENVYKYEDNSATFAYSNTWNEIYGWDFYIDGTYPTVSFDNDSYSLSQFNSEYLTEGSIVSPAHNTDANATYTFMGWYSDSMATAPVAYPCAVYKDITLYAKWYVNGLTGDGSTATGGDGAVLTYSCGTSSATIKNVSTASSKLYVPDTITSSGKAYKVVALGGNTDNTNVTDIVLTNAANFSGMTENVFYRFKSLKKLTLSYSGTATADFKVVPVTMKATYDGTEYEYTFYAVYSNDTAANTSYGTKLIAFIGNTVTASKEILGDASTTVLDFTFSIPTGVTEIYSHAFANSGLKTVYIPSTVKTIGDDAFGSELEKLQIAKTVYFTDISFEAISSSAPIMTSAAASTTYKDYIEVRGLMNQYAANTASYFYAIGNALVGYSTNITSYASLTLPAAVNGFAITVIASRLNINYDTVSITCEILGLPLNLVKINADAFAAIDVTTNVSYEGTALTDIADGVFGDTEYYENSSSDALYLGKVLLRWSGTGSNEVTVKDGTVTIAFGAFASAQATKITLPSSVVKIADSAFYGNANLKTVNIPNSVTSIGNDAFSTCPALETVTIDTIKSSLATIGDKAFYGCKALQTLRLPASLTSIGDNAFNNCTKLQTITFIGYDTVTGDDGATTLVANADYPSKLSAVGSSAFMNCAALTAVAVPNGLTAIRDSTFNNCISLTDITFDVVNSKLASIGNQAFSGCVKLGSRLDLTDTSNVTLTTVILPNRLISVGSQAFMNCTGMWGIQFNYNINSIGSGVFSGCTNLAKIDIYRSTAPTIYNDTFTTNGRYRLRIYLNNDGEITVDSATVSKSVNAYKNSWSNTWSDCGDYLYERGDVPTVIYTYEAAYPNVKDYAYGDVIVTPKANFGGANYVTFKYTSLVQASDRGGAADTTRPGTFVTAYGSQTYTDPSTGNIYTILIADYDVVTLEYATQM